MFTRAFPRPKPLSAYLVALALTLSSLLGAALSAQEAGQNRRIDPNRPPTAADYARAEKFLAAGVTPLVVGGAVGRWLPDERFCYRNQTADGDEFVLVSPATRSRGRVRPRQAGGDAVGGRGPPTPPEAAVPGDRALARREGVVRPGQAPMDVRRAGHQVRRRRGCRAGCRAADAAARGVAGRARRRAGASVPSPDGKRAVVHPRLEPVGPRRRHRPGEAADDGRREGLRLRHRQRRLGDERPADRALVARLEEDRHLPAGRAQGRRHVSRRDEGRPVPPDAARLEVPAARRQGRSRCCSGSSSTRTRPRSSGSQMPPDYHRATLGDNFSLSDMQWSPDGAQLAFVSTSRDHKQAIFRVADAATGAVRTVFERDGEDALRVARRLAGAVGRPTR